jgi:predicted transposase YbfD/YdcC
MPWGLPSGWTEVGAVTLVCRERRVKGRPNESGARYYITSLRMGAAELAGYVRNHWGIENGLHHIRDVTLGEDACRVRCGSAPEVLAALRNVAVHLLTAVDTSNRARAIRRLSTQLHEAIDLLSSPT